MTNPAPKGGRPTSLDHLIDVPAPNGMRRVTAEERIIELMATGAHVDTAAASLGITRESLHTWLKIGGRTRIALTSGKLGHPDDPDAEQPPPDPHSLRCAQFSIAVDAAQAEWLMRQEATLETAVRPRQRKIETRTVDGQGNTVSEATRTETLEPDLATLRWRLERHPASREHYGNRQSIELSGPGGEAVPVNVRIGSLADKIAAVRAKRQTPPEPTGEPDAPDA